MQKRKSGRYATAGLRGSHSSKDKFGGVGPTAYAPLVRAAAAEGLSVHLVKLPGELTAPEKHRQDAIARGQDVIKAKPGVKRLVVGGHSMGGAIAAQFVHEEPKHAPKRSEQEAVARGDDVGSGTGGEIMPSSAIMGRNLGTAKRRLVEKSSSR